MNPQSPAPNESNEPTTHYSKEDLEDQSAQDSVEDSPADTNQNSKKKLGCMPSLLELGIVGGVAAVAVGFLLPRACFPFRGGAGADPPYQPLPKIPGYQPSGDYLQELELKIDALRELIADADLSLIASSPIDGLENTSSSRAYAPLQDLEGASRYMQYVAQVYQQDYDPAELSTLNEIPLSSFSLEYFLSDTLRLNDQLTEYGVPNIPKDVILEKFINAIPHLQYTFQELESYQSVVKFALEHGLAKHSLMNGIDETLEQKALERLEEVIAYNPELTPETAMGPEFHAFVLSSRIQLRLARGESIRDLSSEWLEYARKIEPDSRYSSGRLGVLKANITDQNWEVAEAILDMLQPSDVERWDEQIKIPDAVNSTTDKVPASVQKKLRLLTDAKEERRKSLASESTLYNIRDYLEPVEEAYQQGDLEEAKELLLNAFDARPSKMFYYGPEQGDRAHFVIDVFSNPFFLALNSADLESFNSINGDLARLAQLVLAENSPVPAEEYPHIDGSHNMTTIAFFGNAAISASALGHDLEARYALREAWQHADSNKSKGAPMFFVDEFPENIVVEKEDPQVRYGYCGGCGARLSPSYEDNYAEIRGRDFLLLADYAYRSGYEEELEASLFQSRLAALSMDSNLYGRLDSLCRLIEAYCDYGREDEAKELMPELVALSEYINANDGQTHSYEVRAHLALENYEAAIEALQRAADEKNPGLKYILMDVPSGSRQTY